MSNGARSRAQERIANMLPQPAPPDLTPENAAPRPTFKITIWRAMNSIVILGFGSAKAVLAFRNNPSADAFDVALGLIWALIAYWCGILEAECPCVAPWLFEVDVKEPLVHLTRLVLEENVFLFLCLVAAGVVTYARMVEHVFLVLIYILIFVGALGVALPAVLWFVFVYTYTNAGRLWNRVIASNPGLFDGWWNVPRHVIAMEGRQRRRYIWFPYIVCITSTTIFVHPFPLTPYMPTLMAVPLVNILVFLASYALARTAFAFWRWFSRMRRETDGLQGLVRNWWDSVRTWARGIRPIERWRSGDAVEGVEGLEMVDRRPV